MGQGLPEKITTVEKLLCAGLLVNNLGAPLAQQVGWDAERMLLYYLKNSNLKPSFTKIKFLKMPTIYKTHISWKSSFLSCGAIIQIWVLHCSSVTFYSARSRGKCLNSYLPFTIFILLLFFSMMDRRQSHVFFVREIQWWIARTQRIGSREPFYVFNCWWLSIKWLSKIQLKCNLWWRQW